MKMQYKAVMDLESILQNEKAGEIIKYLMEEYAKQSVSNARELHKHTNWLVDSIIEKTARRNQELYHAGTMLVFQRSMPANSLVKDPSTAFAVMVPVCKALFPKGTADGESEADRRYFNQFLELFRNEKAFDWKNDKRWTDTMGYTEYLQLVEQKNPKK